jgi:hypothetical protein
LHTHTHTDCIHSIIHTHTHTTTHSRTDSNAYTDIHTDTWGGEGEGCREGRYWVGEKEGSEHGVQGRVVDADATRLDFFFFSLRSMYAATFPMSAFRVGANIPHSETIHQIDLIFGPKAQSLSNEADPGGGAVGGCCLSLMSIFS